MSAKQAKRLRQSMRAHGIAIGATYYNQTQNKQTVKQTNTGMRTVVVTTAVELNPKSGRALYKKVKGDMKRNKQTLAQS